MNDSLYMLFAWSVEYAAPIFGYGRIAAQLATRCIVGCVLILWIAWVMRKGYSDSLQMWERALFIVAGLFMLSPTQFPWYYVWVLPFLTVRPMFSLLALNALLPFYYIRFHFKALDNVGVFDNLLVWIQYVPVWLLIVLEITLPDRFRKVFHQE